MTIYKLYGSVTGDSVASLDIQLDGEIMAIHMTQRVTGVDALEDGAEAELSFLSTNSFANNDVRGSLMTIQGSLGVLTQGGNNTGINAQVSSLEIPVSAGERIHLHINLRGGASAANTHAYLYVRDKGVARIPGRRR